MCEVVQISPTFLAARPGLVLGGVLVLGDN